METKKKDSQAKRLAVLAVVALAVAYFALTTVLAPAPATESGNARFNEWVRFYRAREGYTVEPRDLDGFAGEDHVVRQVQPNQFDGVIVSAHGAEGAVTVYYDWRQEVLFHEAPGSGESVVLYVAGF